MDKFTAGEWMCGKYFSGDYGVYSEKKGREIALVRSARTKEETECNVKLIGSAPDLLENLQGTMKALQRVLDKYDPDSIEYEWVGNANEAILKATK